MTEVGHKRTNTVTLLHEVLQRVKLIAAEGRMVLASGWGKFRQYTFR